MPASVVAAPIKIVATTHAGLARHPLLVATSALAAVTRISRMLQGQRKLDRSRIGQLLVPMPLASLRRPQQQVAAKISAVETIANAAHSNDSKGVGRIALDLFS